MPTESADTEMDITGQIIRVRKIKDFDLVSKFRLAMRRMSKLPFAKLYDRETVIPAADLLNDRIVQAFLDAVPIAKEKSSQPGHGSDKQTRRLQGTVCPVKFMLLYIERMIDLLEDAGVTPSDDPPNQKEPKGGI